MGCGALEVGGDVVGEDGTVGGRESMISLSSSSVSRSKSSRGGAVWGGEGMQVVFVRYVGSF